MRWNMACIWQTDVGGRRMTENDGEWYRIMKENDDVEYVEFVKFWHFVGHKSCWGSRLGTFSSWSSSSESSVREPRDVQGSLDISSIGKIGVHWSELEWNQVNWSEWPKEQMIQIPLFSKSLRSTYVNPRLQAIEISWLCVEATHHQRHILRLRDAWPACFSRKGLNLNFRFDCLSDWLRFSFLLWVQNQKRILHLISWLNWCWKWGFTTEESHVIVDERFALSIWPGIIWHCSGAGIPVGVESRWFPMALWY